MKYFFITLILSCACSLQAQDTSSATETRTNDEISIPESRYDQLKEAEKEYENLKKENDALKKELETLRRQSSTDASKLKELTMMQRSNDSLQTVLKETDKQFIRIASNFLYIPYESYSINKLAIPTFEKASTGLKEKHQIRYELLKSYKQDTQSLLDFIIDCDKRLGGHFVDKTIANNLLQELHNQSFYKNYKRYNDWTNTYLGKEILNVESQLKAFDGSKNKFSAGKIKTELQSCLKTAEQ